MKKYLNRVLRELMFYLAGILGKTLVDIIFLLARVEYLIPEKTRKIIASEQFILAVWHGRMLAYGPAGRGHRAACMVSRSDDGEFVSRMLKRHGHFTFRGSTRKGGRTALEEMADFMNTKKRPAILVPDGPTGPIYEAKRGIVDLAFSTGYPVIPFTFSGERVKVFGSWDKCMIPKPFSRCRIVYGEPIYIEKGVGEDDVEAYRVRIEKALNSLTEKCDSDYNLKLS